MKKFLFLSLVLVLTAQQIARAQEDNYMGINELNAYYSMAWKNSALGEHQKALKYMDSALNIAPQFSPLVYDKAKLTLIAGNSKEALSILELLQKQRQQIVKNARYDSLFNSHPEFKGFLHNLNLIEKPISSAVPLIKLEETDLVPEGVAYDSVTESLYISSIYKRKIIKIDVNREVTNFTTIGQEGLLSVLGMEVDPVKRHLWVCSSYDPSNEIIKGDGLRSQAAIHKLDIKTGKLLKKYQLSDSLPHFFNDLTILPDGDIFFTDSNIGTVYKISTKEDEIMEVFTYPFLISANGITKDDKGENIFIASWLRGIIKYHVKSKTWKWLKTADSETVTSGIDGMAYYKGSLIVNSPLEIRGVLKLNMNHDEDTIESTEILEYLNPLFGEPTTGEIGRGKFFFIANSGVSAYDNKTGKLEKEKLVAPVILKINLNSH